jgi:hypothetical protein
MDNLIIAPTQYTPNIELLKDGKIIIKGKSYPENTFDFYKPVMAWLRDFFSSVDDNKSLSVVFEIVYFNSSSSKLFFDFFDMLDSNRENCVINVNWLYSADNELAEEAGEDFIEDFPSLNVKMICLP